ncbi:hypothetical protein Agub_g2016, partial [Astrephomene gubernaculifera]
MELHLRGALLTRSIPEPRRLAPPPQVWTRYARHCSVTCKVDNDRLYFQSSGRSRQSTRWMQLHSTRAAADAPAPTSTTLETSPTVDLESFLAWLVANGVQGIGREDSKVALFQSAEGERGLLCEEPISAGEEVLRVPLRLALTEHPGDQESNTLLYEGAPW